MPEKTKTEKYMKEFCDRMHEDGIENYMVLIVDPEVGDVLARKGYDGWMAKMGKKIHDHFTAKCVDEMVMFFNNKE